jgi:cytidylate kinase
VEVITISRQFGAGGGAIGKNVAEKLGFLFVNHEVINEGLAALGIPAQFLNFEKSVKTNLEKEKKYMFYLTALHEFIMDLATKNSIVLMGRGGHFLFKNHPKAFHVRIQAPLEQRLSWVQRVYRMDEKAALRLVQEKDRHKKRFIREIFDQSWADVEMFDLVLNTGKISPAKATKLIVHAFNSRKKDAALTEIKAATSQGKEIFLDQARFMHPSEAEFAKVLDFYKILWEYEPRTFALEWDKEGNITEAFSPDFYLPDFDIYIELTTQKQKLVWKKNSKLHRLRELYPDINAKIVYGKDYLVLLKKLAID